MNYEKRIATLEKKIKEIKEEISKGKLEYIRDNVYIFKDEDGDIYLLQLIREKEGNNKHYTWVEVFGDCYWNGFHDTAKGAIESVKEENIVELRDAQEISQYFSKR